jgi:hypothetical protein
VTSLFTSRKRLEHAAPVESIDVDVLDSAAAVALLSSDVPGRAQLSQEEWGHIADWVGGLPLALVLLHRALRLTATTPRRLYELSLHKSTTMVLDEQMDAVRGAVPAGAVRGITEAFATSYGLLDDDAKRLARVIAWFAPAPIPDELLLRVSSESPESNEAAARVTLVDRSLLTEARREDVTAASHWQMHRVLGDFLLTQDAVGGEFFLGLAALDSFLESLDLDDPKARALGLEVVDHAAHFANSFDHARWPSQDQSIARGSFDTRPVCSKDSPSAPGNLLRWKQRFLDTRKLCAPRIARARRSSGR